MSGERAGSAAARRASGVVRRVIARAERIPAAPVLGLAIACQLALGLWLTRGVTFTTDELVFFIFSGSFSPDSLLFPYGSHVVATPRLLFNGSLSLFGADHVPVQILAMLSAAAAAVALYLLLRRLTAPPLALAAAILVLFWGSTPESLQGNTIMWTLGVAGSLFALFAFDHRTWRWDVAACASLLFAAFTIELGVLTAGAVVIWIVIQRDWGRLWVPAVPLLAFAAWWVWALQFDQSQLDLAGPGSIAHYALDSAAGGAAALSGFGIPFEPDAARHRIAHLGLGYALLAGGAILVVAGLRGRRPPPLWWATLAYLLAFWIAGALAEGAFREPEATRYSYAVGIGLLVLLAASWRGRAPSPGAILALLLVALIALIPNLWQLRQRGADVRLTSLRVQAGLAAPDLLPAAGTAGDTIAIFPPLAEDRYRAAADRYGSLGLTPAELRAQPPAIRTTADRSMVTLIDPRLVFRPRSCDGQGGDPRASAPLPPGGAVLRSRAGATLRLNRFGLVRQGADLRLPPGKPAILRLPVDRAPEPWILSAEAGQRFEVCAALR